jgi:hypothetical protein
METVLKFDRVILTKELNDKFRKVGDAFEVANILEDSFLLRDAKTKVALGVVSFSDFDRCFVVESNYTGWTQWAPIVGFNRQSDAYYRTNRRKVQVKFITDKVRAESCCHRGDEFNLYFGIQTAYLRCFNKLLERQRNECLDKLDKIRMEFAENKQMLKKMFNSLSD